MPKCRARGGRSWPALLTLLWMALFTVSAAAGTVTETYKVGFLARDGESADKSEFQPTIAALNQEFKSRSRTQRLSLVKLSFEEVMPEVRSKQVDFLIVDPELYVMTEDLGTTALASLRRKYEGREVSSYGGVIFGVDGRCNVNPGTKLLGGKVAAVSRTSRDGFGMQKAELERRGILWNEASVSFKGSHSAVVDAVVAKKVDCGFVRTGSLEQFARAWKFKLSRFQGLFLDGQGQNSHYIMSTNASSEWPFVALAHVDPSSVELVALGLAIMKPYPNPRFKDEMLRWAYPLSYEAARERRYLSAVVPAMPAPVEPPSEPAATDAALTDAAATDAALTDAAATDAPTIDLAATDEAALPSPESVPTTKPTFSGDPPVELLVVLGVLLGLVCVIAIAAYLVGRSAGFSRALTADWSNPTERLPSRPDIDVDV